MLQSVEVPSVDEKTSRSHFSPFIQRSTTQLRVLRVGDYLFKEGDPRAFVYRVEKGIVSVFQRRIGRPVSITAMAGEGDYVGLGCLDHHRDNARAVVDSVVSLVPRSEFVLIAELDPKLAQMQLDAIQHDFEFGKVLRAGSTISDGRLSGSAA